MFKPIKPYQETITGHKDEPQIRIGSAVPEHAVNLAYYYNPTATDSEKILTSDAPRNTIDHRVENAYRYLFNQASKDDELFPKTVLYEDEEGYIGNLGRLYVRWHENAHIETKNIIRKKSYAGLVNKEDIPKIISYEEDEYSGNLFLDAVDYTISEYKTIGEKKLVEKEILNHELTMFVNAQDLNTWMKDPRTNSNSPWPKTLTVNELNITNVGGKYTPSVASNPYDKYTGELTFDNLEYEEVRTADTPSPEFRTQTGIITLISSTAISEYATAENKDTKKTKFDQLTKATYRSLETAPYNTEIKDFLHAASLKYCPTRNSSKAYLDLVENIDNENTTYLIEAEPVCEHQVTDLDVTKYYFTKTFIVTKTSKGRDIQSVYSVYANYIGVLTKYETTEKQIPYRYSAEGVYKGMIRKVWYDYDGMAYYRGSVIKCQGIGNMNNELSNDVLMFPDDSGKLFRISSTGNKITKLEAEQFYITNVFKDNVPCWYQSKLKKPIYDYRTPDTNGFYTGDNIKVFSSNLKGISDRERYQLRLIPKEYETITEIVGETTTERQIPKNYDAYIYTSFLSTATNTYKALYNSFMPENHNDNNGIIENLYTAPFMIPNKDFKINTTDKIVRENEIIITNPTIIEDTRRRITFDYRIFATRKTDGHIVSSTIKTASIINKEYALKIELNQFIERGMIISPKKDDIYMSPMDIILADQSEANDDNVIKITDTDFIFEVKIESISNEFIGAINIRCNPDGSGVLTAETTLDTGFYNTENGTFTEKLYFDNPYFIEGNKIYGGYMVRCLDSRSIGINQPRENKILESWYPMIRFGHYSQTMCQYGINERIIYSMPEYDTQYFSETYHKPFVDIKNETAEIINSHIIKIKCTPLFLFDLENINNNVKVIKHTGQEDIILTVKDISFTDGVIFIKDIISENDNITVDYTYMEENYVYRGYWKDLDFCRIDLNPNQYHTYSDLNKVPSVTSPTMNLFNKTIYFYLRPSCYRKYEHWTEKVEKEVTTEKYVEETNIRTEEVPVWDQREVITYITTYEPVACETMTDIYNDGACGDSPSSDKTKENFILSDNGIYKTTINSKKIYTKNQYSNYELEYVIKPLNEYETSNSNAVYIIIAAIYDETNACLDTIGLKISPNRPYSDYITGNFKLYAIINGKTYNLAEDETMENVTESTWKTRWPNGMKIKIIKKDNVITIYRSAENTLELINDPVITYAIPEDKIIYEELRKPSYFGFYITPKYLQVILNPQNSSASRTVVTEQKTMEDYISHYETKEYTETNLVKKEFTETIIENVDHETRDEQNNTTTLYHTIDKFEPESDMDLYIGSVFIRQNTSLESTVLVDTRTRGGGIIESMKDELRQQLEPESDFYLDIGYYDGKPYQENGVIIVRLDNSILIENGGRFTQSDVETKVKTWLGYGIYPIIEYVDSYSKYDMPQYNLQIENSYTNVQYEPFIFSLDCVEI